MEIAVKNPSEKLAAPNDALYPLMEELRLAFVNVINQGTDVAKFVKAVERLNEFRIEIMKIPWILATKLER